MFLDDRDSEINGLLIKLIAADPVGCFLLGCDEDEAIDAGDPHVPSGLDEVAELSARLSERRGRRILGGLEVDDVVLPDTIDAGFDFDTTPLSEVRYLGLDAIQ